MDSSEQDNQPKSSETADKGLFTKIFALGGVIVLLTYGKILWPLIYGRMRDEGISFSDAAKDASLHSVAFGLLVVVVIVGIAWGWSRSQIK